MRGLDLPALNGRLRTSSDAPLAVAVSGGGDSLALLLATKAWADAHGRTLLVLTVDHGVNPASPGWTRRCADTAARLGVAFHALSWTGDKPATGLPAAARRARHALLADAAREAGARVVLMGHTADDLIEAAAMRAEGSTVSDPAEWAPSPAWPEGRGVFLLRPMLHLRRQALRDWLSDQGESWIEDPANIDLRSARARARRSSSAGGGEDPPKAAVEATAPLQGFASLPGGGLSLPRATTAGAVAAACLCAAGTARPPRGDRLARLVDRLRSGEAFIATLAGARIDARGETAVFMRDSGEAARGGLAPLALPVGQAAVWDGRYEIAADRPGLTVRALAGQSKRLPRAEQDALRTVPAAARPSLPVIEGPDGPSCPILAEVPAVRWRDLAPPRFEAATGKVDSEPAV